MAEAWGENFEKRCEDCKALSDPNSFARGANVRYEPDCSKCEVVLKQPIEANLNIIELYNILPANFEGFSGLRQMSATDISFLFDLYKVNKEKRYDYYQRLVYLQSQIIVANSEKNAAKLKKKEGMSDSEWKSRALAKSRKRMTS